MHNHRSVHRTWSFLAVVMSLLVVACGNAGDDAEGGAPDADPTETTQPGDTTDDDEAPAAVPGVTDTEIRVAGLVSLTGPLGQQFRGSEAGFRAYITYINEQGGVHDRTINLVKVANDNTDSARNLSEAEALVEQDGVFAVIPVSTPVFGAAQYLADNGVPTFGWNIQDEWRFGDSLIGFPTSWFRPEAPEPILGPTQSYIARSLGFTKVGVIAYTAPQSKTCGDNVVAGFELFGLDVVFVDTSLPLGVQDLTADVQKMKEEGVEYVVTCIDVNGNVLLARTLQREGLDVAMSWPTGYEDETLESFGDLLDNVYFTTAFLPFQSPESSPGLQLYLEQLPQREPDAEIGNQTLIGWINGMLFVAGLEEAGRDLTRQGLVETIRGWDSWDAEGILAPTDFTTPPELRDTLASCGGAVVAVEDGAFAQVFSKPFLCLGAIRTAEDLEELLVEEAGG